MVYVVTVVKNGAVMSGHSHFCQWTHQYEPLNGNIMSRDLRR
jgi:hypothetical protein